MSGKKKETTQPTRLMGWRIPVELAERIEHFAAVEGRPASWAARDALALGMEILEKKPEQAKAMRVAKLGKGGKT